MFVFFFPYSTDAPVYHWPYGTIGLIVANFVVYFGWLFGIVPEGDLVLTYGDGLHPLQWLLSAFMHADPLHLIGNMMTLWAFGLVIEGKLGAARFLACYVGVAVAESAVEQLVMLPYAGESPGSLGASTAIYGMIAMAVVWAPKNEINFFWLFVLFFRPFVGTFDIPIAILCVAYLGFDLLDIVLSGGGPASGWLHFGGAVFGFPLGVAMLKLGMVDCEGWDLFHVWKGDPGGVKSKEKKHQQRVARKTTATERRDAEILAGAKQQLRAYLAAGNGVAALTLIEKMREVGDGLRLDEAELAHLVKSLHAARRWRESAPYLARLIELRGERADPLRLKLAQICVVELGRPGRALDLLDEVNAPELEPAQQRLAAKIRQRAESMQRVGEVELDDDKW